MRRILIVLVLAVALVLSTAPVQAAQLPCQHYQTVYPLETLGMISRYWNVPAYDIRSANKAMMTPPGYPVMLGGRVCIPAPTGKAKALPDWLLNQSPATVTARAVLTGRYPLLQLTVENFSPHRNWTVKVNNIKIGKMLVLKKKATLFTYRLPAGKPTKVCIKDQMSDYAQCYTIYYPK